MVKYHESKIQHLFLQQNTLTYKRDYSPTTHESYFKQLKLHFWHSQVTFTEVDKINSKRASSFCKSM